MRVLQICSDFDFLQEALRAESFCELWFENLEGNLPVVPQILSEVDRGHAAFAERPLDEIAAGECVIQIIDLGGWFAHTVQLEGSRSPNICVSGPVGELRRRGLFYHLVSEGLQSRGDKANEYAVPGTHSVPSAKTLGLSV